MDDAELTFRFPTVEEFLALRRSAGWHVPAPDAVAEALKNSLFGVCIEKGGQCLGTGRIVGDAALTYTIQDVVVLPEYQRKGYGTMIMDALMEYIEKNAQPSAYIAVFAAKGREHFYSRYGFIERPSGQHGPGMAFFKS